jgi:lysophospholipase L1-like esterase
MPETTRAPFALRAYVRLLPTFSVPRIRRAYRDRPPGEVVFYGASNFTFWKTMEQDLAPFVIQNHGFGGSTDDLLRRCAPQLLFPYRPSVVVFQTGSNDLAFGKTLDQVLAHKFSMFDEFRAELPTTRFIIMSGLPLPGREALWESTRTINAAIASYVAQHDLVTFADATSVLLDDRGGLRPELFRKDGIHLIDSGRAEWSKVIVPALTAAGAPTRSA